MSTVHIYPTGDLIDHDTDIDECDCGTTTEAVPFDDGGFGWLIVHHSLDGREHDEPNHEHATCPSCTARANHSTKETDR